MVTFPTKKYALFQFPPSESRYKHQASKYIALSKNPNRSGHCLQQMKELNKIVLPWSEMTHRDWLSKEPRYKSSTTKNTLRLEQRLCNQSDAEERLAQRPSHGTGITPPQLSERTEGKMSFLLLHKGESDRRYYGIYFNLLTPSLTAAWVSWPHFGQRLEWGFLFHTWVALVLPTNA